MQPEVVPASTQLRLIHALVRRNCALLFIPVILVLVGCVVVAHVCGFSLAEANGPVRASVDGCNSNTALVLLAHDREEYLRQTLTSLSRARGLEHVCLFLSIDNGAFLDRARELTDEVLLSLNITTIYHEPTIFTSWTPDQAITWHHKQVFNAIFIERSLEFGILLETDLIVSPDFLEYMLQGRPLLSDPGSALFCVSAWNDNGFDHLILREDRLYRTDFFPGLGWMLHRDSWVGILKNDWPVLEGYDWHIRDQLTLKRLQCIAPEVSRTHHIAKYGTHVNGNAHSTYDRMVLATGDVVITQEEWKIVTHAKSFQDRLFGETIAREHITFRNDPLHFLGALNGYRDSNIVAVMNQKNMQIVLSRLQLYSDQLRADYHGQLTIHIKTTSNHISLVYEHMYQQLRS